MGANLSGKDIDNGDFMIKTSVADPEAGYAKEKFRADPKNGIIISEVDGAKGKRLDFSADWSVVSLETKLQKGENVAINEDQVSGKVQISAPDVGKVKYENEFLDLAEGDGVSLEKDGSNLKVSAPNNGKVKYENEFLDLAEGDGVSLEKDGSNLKVSAPNNGKVLVNSSDATPGFLNNKIEVFSPLQKFYDASKLQIKVLDKLNFAQFEATWVNGDYDKSAISYYYDKTAMLGRIHCSNTTVLGVCFVVTQGNPLTLYINYMATSNVDCVLYYRTIGDANWYSQSVTLVATYDVFHATYDVFQTSCNVPDIGDGPMEFLLVCEEDMGENVAGIFEIYAD